MKGMVQKEARVGWPSWWPLACWGLGQWEEVRQQKDLITATCRECTQPCTYA